ncbi:MAG: LamG domain-containing protein, partial [Candidatus Taylorbacteria bacterium]
MTSRLFKKYRYSFVGTIALILFFVGAIMVKADALLPGDISTCGELGVSGTPYTLTTDVASTTGTCFSMTTDGVVLDAQGHSIRRGGPVDLTGNIGLYHMDDISSGSVIDSSGNNNNGSTILGSVSTVPGITGNALNFNGNGYVTDENFQPQLGPNGDYSISAWIKPTSANTGNNVIFRIVNSDGNNYGSYNVGFWSNQNGDNPLSVNVYTGEAWQGGNQLTANLPDFTNWHLMTFTYVASTRLDTMYIDGVQAAQNTDNGSGNEVVQRLELGGDYEDASVPTDISQVGALYNGGLDDLAIFNRTLSPSEVSAIYNAGLLGIGLNAGYPIDGAGHSFTLLNASITGIIVSPGGTLSIANSTLATIDVSSPTGSNSIGGSISLDNSTFTTLKANGDTTARGGIITITAPSLDLSNAIISATGGNNGTLTINALSTPNLNNTTVSALTDFNINGVDHFNFPGGVGPFVFPGPIDSCGTIQVPGTYYLTQDFTASGTCFTVMTDGVTISGLDPNDNVTKHTVTGNGSGYGIDARGINSNGHDVTVQDITINNFSESIDTNGPSAADETSNSGYNAGNITITDSVISNYINAIGGTGSSDNNWNWISNGNGGNGGTITITNSVIRASVLANGGGGGSGPAGGASGGNGGSISISGTNLDLSDSSIYANGGDGGNDEGTGNGNGSIGSDGTLTLTSTGSLNLNNTNVSALSDFVINGNDYGAFTGGTGPFLFPGHIASCGTLIGSGTYIIDTDISVSGRCFTISSDNTMIDGQGHSITGSGGDYGIFAAGANGSNGFNITVENVTMSGFSPDIGTTGSQKDLYNQGSPSGSGGDVTIINSILTNIIDASGAAGGDDSNWYYWTPGTGGNGGTITITNSTTSQIQSIGGNGGGGPDCGGGTGGNGGPVSIINSVTSFLDVSGGVGGSSWDCGGSGTAGSKGTVSLTFDGSSNVSLGVLALADTVNVSNSTIVASNGQSWTGNDNTWNTNTNNTWIFNGNSYNAGTIDAPVTFNNTSHNAGPITGDVT